MIIKEDSMSRSRKNVWLTSLTTIALVSLMISLLTLLGSARTSPTSSTSLAAPTDRNPVNVWLTTADLRAGLAQQGSAQFASGDSSEIIKITVDDSKTYQSIDGFGASLTDGSAWLISQKMNQQQRNDLMVKLFDPVRGIGMDFLRQPMGASDLTTPTSGEYSYDDVPAGQTDPDLTHFSIAHDQAYIIPLLQQALKLNPNLKIMATPWSPPAWMKSDDSMEGGTLNTSAYAAYAQYFVKYIQAYRAQGIPIYAALWQELVVPADAPPLFLLIANDDPLIKDGSIPMYSAWKKAGIAVELHIYARGGHGFGMNKQGLPTDHWIERFGEWLQSQGFPVAQLP
jgi:glucosylceramidase